MQREDEDVDTLIASAAELTLAWCDRSGKAIAKFTAAPTNQTRSALIGNPRPAKWYERTETMPYAKIPGISQ